ncbi:hypothetical protein HMPREF1870_00203 [Bacteroidales bacterium KA00344]|nr:hypothetical protein HMPREF1870_00203 [Bacteroidales bacterium KA00344]
MLLNIKELIIRNLYRIKNSAMYIWLNQCFLFILQIQHLNR